MFSGVVGAPAQCFPVQASCGGPYTTLATSPVTREAPYLYQDSRGNYKVFVPAVQHESSGTTWQNGETRGSSIPVRRFFIAQPTDSAEKINRVLFFGFDLILTPGVYKLDRSIEVTRPDTVVVGLGFPTLIPENGSASITVASDDGVLISGSSSTRARRTPRCYCRSAVNGALRRPRSPWVRPVGSLRCLLSYRRRSTGKRDDQSGGQQRQRHPG